MSERFDPHVDTLVRQYLQRQAETVDARKMLDGVRARLATGGVQEQDSGADFQSARKPMRPLRYWRRVLAAAAVVLVAVGVWSVLGSRASAEDWVRSAQQAHNQALERCYRVTAQVEGRRLEGLPLAQKENRLWTRGNEFWVEPTAGNRNWAWGQDNQGRVWAALGRQRGVRFDADRIPEPLALACAIRGMQVDTLLGELLADFDLSADAAAATEPGTTCIRATPKPGSAPSTLRAVTLEIDDKSHVIRRAVVERQFSTGAKATVTFSLVDSRPASGNAYTLEGHLDAGGVVIANPTSWRALLLAGHNPAP